MEKKPQILNLRKPEPEVRLPARETTQVAPKHEPIAAKSLHSERPPLPNPQDTPVAPRHVVASGERSWGFVVKQKTLRGKKLLFVTAGIILAGALVWVVSPNVPLLMVIGLSVCVVMIKAYVPGKDAEVEFGDRGIRINDSFYSSATLASFHIDETEADFPELSFDLKQRLMPRIKIPLPRHLVSQTRDSLRFMALEVEHEPSFGELLSKKFRL